MSAWPQVAMQATQIGIALAAKWILDINITPGDDPDLKFLYRPLLVLRPMNISKDPG